MIAEKYLKKRYQDGMREAATRPKPPGRAWYERWQAARRRGEDFDEPPPEMKD